MRGEEEDERGPGEKRNTSSWPAYTVKLGKKEAEERGERRERRDKSEMKG